MTLDEAEALKAELVAEAERPAMSFVQSRIDSNELNGFMRSILERPVSEFAEIFSTREPLLLGAAQRGHRIRDAAIPAMRAFSTQSLTAHGAAEEAQPAVSIGLSSGSGDAKGKDDNKADYKLEVRLQDPTVATILYAQEIVRRAAGEARVGQYRDLAALARRPAGGGTAGKSRLSIGDSVGHLKCSGGTLGVFMRSPDGVGVLSNSHVIAWCGRARRGDPIYSPHRAQDGDAKVIGKLQEFSDLMHDDDIPFDAAFALLEKGVGINGNTVPPAMTNGGKKIVAGKGEIVPGFKVCKIGWSTRHTTGYLNSIGQSPTLDYDGLGKVKLKGMLEIVWDKPEEPFSARGDSGSLVYRQDTMEAVGIVVGGGVLEIEGASKGVTMACPLDTIAAQWNLKLA